MVKTLLTNIRIFVEIFASHVLKYLAVLSKIPHDVYFSMSCNLIYLREILQQRYGYCK